MSDTYSGLKSPTGSYKVGAYIFKLLVRRWGCGFYSRNVERCDNYVCLIWCCSREKCARLRGVGKSMLVLLRYRFEFIYFLKKRL